MPDLGVLVGRLVEDVGPRLPVRDLLTLREHHHGLSGDELAAALVTAAARTTAAVGAGAGVLAAAEATAPVTLVAAPLQLVAETLAVVAVEVKLVAELHVVYGRAVTGPRRDVLLAYLAAWAGRHAAEGPTGSRSAPPLSSVLSSAAAQQLRSRVVRRIGRNASSLAPFLAGALAGAELNRRETRAVGAAISRDLKARA